MSKKSQFGMTLLLSTILVGGANASTVSTSNTLGAAMIAQQGAVLLWLLPRRGAARHQRGLTGIRTECRGHGRTGGRAACRGGRAAGRAGRAGGPDREKAGAVHLCGCFRRGLLSGGTFQEPRRVCDWRGLRRRLRGIPARICSTRMHVCAR